MSLQEDHNTCVVFVKLEIILDSVFESLPGYSVELCTRMHEEGMIA